MTVREGCGYEIELEASCYNRRTSGRRRRSRAAVLLNEARWVRGAVPFQGDVGSYRQYLINHEVGHAIGYQHHEPCDQNGALAPIMMQQTFSTANNDAARFDPEWVKPDGKVCRSTPGRIPSPDGPSLWHRILVACTRVVTVETCSDLQCRTGRKMVGCHRCPAGQPRVGPDRRRGRPLQPARDPAPIGVVGQRRLKNARVLVIGAGGLGSPTLLYLAAAGVGTIGIVEFDVVDESNLQRQIIHGQSDVGRSKAQSARRLDASRSTPFRSTSGCTRSVLNRQRRRCSGIRPHPGRHRQLRHPLPGQRRRRAGRDKPYVWGSIYRFAGQASVFWEDAPDGRSVNYRDLSPTRRRPAWCRPAPGRRAGHPVRLDRPVMGTEAIKLITGIGSRCWAG